jgi:hypothetical protein
MGNLNVTDMMPVTITFVTKNSDNLRKTGCGG